MSGKIQGMAGLAPGDVALVRLVSGQYCVRFRPVSDVTEERRFRNVTEALGFYWLMTDSGPNSNDHQN